MWLIRKESMDTLNIHASAIHANDVAIARMAIWRTQLWIKVRLLTPWLPRKKINKGYQHCLEWGYNDLVQPRTVFTCKKWSPTITAVSTFISAYHANCIKYNSHAQHLFPLDPTYAADLHCSTRLYHISIMGEMCFFAANTGGYLWHCHIMWGGH